MLVSRAGGRATGAVPHARTERRKARGRTAAASERDRASAAATVASLSAPHMHGRMYSRRWINYGFLRYICGKAVLLRPLQLQ